MPKSAKRYKNELVMALHQATTSAFLFVECELRRLPVAKKDNPKRAALIRELRGLYKEALALRDRAREVAKTLESLSLSQVWMPEREEPKQT